ncbi:MAG TPA: alcohol dehydrogenase catalytic domain-containing protein, partial [Allosphingosinicella sp.]|nr:alcohol dehydrogenase catalytic domain-containing protein [Allosphingosinicella sp.]
MSTIPETMTAIDPAQPGGPEVLEPVERPVPRPGPGEVLIRIEAAGVNRPDVMQRLGFYPPPPGAPSIPGLEVAGTVAALGDGVESHAIGEKVCALIAGGGYAQYCVAPAGQCLPVPGPLSMAEAAALPETFFTVWSNLFQRGAR